MKLKRTVIGWLKEKEEKKSFILIVGFTLGGKLM